ncbi:MAG: hypothetical protein ABL926_13735 [Novosphingobium sp.]|uniref:hypothetical protein n=1 Tax=Novosphingobium sp. TaxID=1874826 RepID=UPI0032B74148
MISLASVLVAASSPHPKPNWDRAWWGMDDPDFFHAYPAAKWPDGSWVASVPASRIARTALLASVIERGTFVHFRFEYDNGYRLVAISFVVAGGYSRAEAALERTLGLPVRGDRTEARCIAPNGERRIEDPSGVGHIIASCLARAAFADRRGGNAVDLASVYDWELKQHGSRSSLERATLVTIEALGICDSCAAPQ